MNDYQTSKNLPLVANSLRILADALENASNVGTLRQVVMGLENAIVLINMGRFNFQKKLILDSKHDFDPTEGTYDLIA